MLTIALFTKKEKVINPDKVISVAKKNKTLSYLSYKRIIDGTNIVEHEGFYSSWYNVRGKGLKMLTRGQTEKLLEGFESFLKKYVGDLKVIISQYPLETYLQEQYWQKKALKSNNPQSKQLQFQKADQLKKFSKNRSTQEYTIAIFGETEEEIYYNQEVLRNTTRSCLDIAPFSEEKIEDLFYFLNNQNSNIFNISKKDRDKKYDIDKLSKKEQRLLEEAGYDLPFIKRTQPQGNMKFNNSYVEIGGSCQNCLTFYDYPTSDLQAFWFIPLVSNKNTISMLDISTADKNKVLNLLKRSTGEQISRVNPKASPIEQKEAIFNYQTQDKLMNEVIVNRVIAKMFKLRIYVHENSQEELEITNRKIKQDLNGRGFKATNFLLGEQLYEFQSLFLPMSEQSKLANKRHGQHIASDDLAGGYLFNHMALQDPTGSIMGVTATNGAFLLDINHRNDRRTRSTMLVSGNAGMGKSTFSKKVTDDNACRENFTRVFSVNDEYNLLTEYHNGKIINMDGSQGAINIFEIFPTTTLADGVEIDEIASFNSHINKLDSIFQLKQNGVTPETLTLHAELLTDFYIEDQGMWFKNPQRHKEEIKVTGLPTTQYPLLEEWIIYLKSKMRTFIAEGYTSTRIDQLTSIISTYNLMLTQEGSIFNQYTSIENFEQIKFVNFDFSSLKAASQNTFNAQLFNVLFLVNAHAVNNGKKQRQLLRSHMITPDDFERYLLVMDEGQNFLKSDYPQSAIVISTIMEEMRKYYAGIVINLPSIQTILPTELEASNPKYLEALRKIFGLLQYRVFFQTDSSAIDTLSKTLKNSLTIEELNILPRLAKTECLFNINGDQNIQLRVMASNEELIRFDGGE
ncbi:hypothetical protein [Enterococcus alishanensis]